MNTSDINPRSVTPGIETQSESPTVEESQPLLPPPGVHVRMDWLRLVGQETSFEPLLLILKEAFGEPTSESSGAKWFRGGMNWHPGVTLSHGHPSSILQLDLRGERLNILGTDAAISLMGQIYDLHGFWATRIDAAIDFVEQNLKLHHHASNACRQGQLCRMRRFADDSEYTASNEPTRLLLKLGKRESAICGRIYDKGLQTGSAPAGAWERLEIEFKEDRAKSLALQLLECPSEWPRTLKEVVFGAIDFRIDNGRTEIDRRPRVSWWAALVDDTDCQPIQPVPASSSFETWWEWGRTSFAARFLQVCEILKLEPEQLMPALLHGLKPATSVSALTVELRALAKQGQYPNILLNLQNQANPSI